MEKAKSRLHTVAKSLRASARVSDAGTTSTKTDNGLAPTKYKIFTKEDGTDIYANKDQTKAIDTLKKWKDSGSDMFVLSGRGGTGKTTVIGTALEEMGIDKGSVLFALPTHKAKQVIQENNPDYSDFTTLASLSGKRKYRGEFVETGISQANKDLLATKEIILIDEASMLDEGYLEVIDSLIQESKYNDKVPNLKVIYMGDNVQIPAVDTVTKLEAGDAINISPVFSGLSGLAQRLSETIDTAHNGSELLERMRQGADSPILNITDAFANAIEQIFSTGVVPSGKNPNVILSGVDDATADGSVKYMPKNGTTIDAFVEDYNANPYGTKWINYNNFNHGNTINLAAEIRGKLFDDPQAGKINRETINYTDKYGEAQSFVKIGLAKPYIKGEHLVVGESASVIKKDGAKSVVDNTVLHNGDEVVVVEEMKPGKVSMEVMIDPRIDFEDRPKKSYLNDIKVNLLKVKQRKSFLDENGEVDYKYVEQLIILPIEDYRTGTKLSLKKAISMKAGIPATDQKYYYDDVTKGLSPAYIINTHKSQGSTYDTVYVDYDNITKQNGAPWPDKLRSMYVATSRPSKDLVMVGGSSKTNKPIQLGTGKTVAEIQASSKKDSPFKLSGNKNSAVNESSGEAMSNQKQKTTMSQEQTQSLVDSIANTVGLKVKVMTEEEAILYAKQSNIPDYKNRRDNGALHAFMSKDKNINGQYSMYINPQIKGSVRNDIIAHEIGHAVMSEYLANASNVEIKAIKNEYNKWVKNNNKDNNTYESIMFSKKTDKAAFMHVINLNTKLMQQGKNAPFLKDLTSKDRTQLFSFNEWFADNASKALLRKSPAIGLVQKFFNKMMQAIKRLFKFTTNKNELSSIELFINRIKRQQPVLANNTDLQQYATKFNTNIAKALDESKLWDKFRSITLDKDTNLRNLGKGKIPAFIKLADFMFKERGAKGNDNSYWHNKNMLISKYDGEVSRIMRGASTHVQKLVMSELYTPSILNKDANSRTVKIRQVYKDIEVYMKDAGVEFKNINSNAKKVNNYFPEIADADYTEEHHDEFINMMSRYTSEMEGISKTWNKQEAERYQQITKEYDRLTAVTEDKLSDSELMRKKKVEVILAEGQTVYTSENIPQVLFDNIVRRDSVEEVETDTQQTPNVRFLNHRIINFLKGEDRINWRVNYLSKSITDTTAAYVSSVVKRVEFEKRFGHMNAAEQHSYVSKIISKNKKAHFTKEEMENFKQEAKNVTKFELLLDQARKEGATNEQIVKARTYMAAEMGTHGRETAMWLHKVFKLPMPPVHSPINESVQLATSTLMSLANVQILGMSTITSLLDPLGILIRTGDLRMATSAWGQGMKSSFADFRGQELRDHTRFVAEAVGSINDTVTKEALAHTYNHTYMSQPIRKLNDGFFKYIGLERLTKTTRLMAVSASMSFLKRHDKNPNKHSERFLGELGIQKGDLRYDKEGKIKVMTYEEHAAATDKEQAADNRVKSAIAEFVDTSILRPSPSQRPVWASDPHWALVFHLKSFMYSFHKTILAPLYNEAKQGNYMPLLYLGVYLPGGIMVGMIKDVIKTVGDDEEDWTPSYKENWSAGQYLVDGLEKSGLTSITQPLFDMKREAQYGGTWWSGALGPALDYNTFIDTNNTIPLAIPVPFNYFENTWSK